MNNIKMLYYEVNCDIFEGNQVIETSTSKECDICHYWLFQIKGLTYVPNLCIECHDVLMMSMNFSDIAILNINNAIIAL